MSSESTQSQAAQAPTGFSLPLQAIQPLFVWGSSDGEPDREGLEELIKRLDTVRKYAGRIEQRFGAETENAHERFRQSARNLLHYLSLRHFDLRPIQGTLSALGLASLDRTEAHTLASVYAVRRALERVIGERVTRSLDPEPAVEFDEGSEFLAANTKALLGSGREGRDVRIMVTLPSAAADDYDIVRELLECGMDCARVNCAHDGSAAWARMIDHLERAKRETGLDCRISMDLAGPKLRTGALTPGPRVIKWKPERDLHGRVVSPARIWFAPKGVKPPGALADAVVPIPAEWVALAEPGDRIHLVDVRDAKRKVRIVACEQGGFWGEARHTAYVETGTELTLVHPASSPDSDTDHTHRIGELPAIEVPIILSAGDTLVLHRDARPGEPAVRDVRGRVIEPAHISCTLPQVFTKVQVGEPIRLDDGKIEGVVRAVSEDEMQIEVTLAKPGGTKLRGDKGINFPESDLATGALTDKDLADLDFVAEHADMVAMSFVNEPGDVLQLHDELQARGGRDIGIVLKIETRRAFQRLPWLLLTAMRRHPVGVMIARGDLAVECGWERLAEVQEEILWLCEAAHVPVIWATQVLEGLAKKGLPSRAEITDAAMGVRAECVMLNKGPYINRAVHTLDHILQRMQQHQVKKGATLRNLTLAGDL